MHTGGLRFIQGDLDHDRGVLHEAEQDLVELVIVVAENVHFHTQPNPAEQTASVASGRPVVPVILTSSFLVLECCDSSKVALGALCKAIETYCASIAVE